MNSVANASERLLQLSKDNQLFCRDEGRSCLLRIALPSLARSVKEPTIFVNRSEGRLLGSDRGDLDAYIFWPRIEVRDGRPDWMVKELGRKPVKIPRQLLNGRGILLVQVFKEGEPASAIPIDQGIIDDQ